MPNLGIMYKKVGATGQVQSPVAPWSSQALELKLCLFDYERL